MVKTNEKIEALKLSELAGWDIAQRFNCGYSGDANPIEHGGFFYDKRRWVEDGGCNVVEFWMDPDADEDTLVVQRGRLYRPTDPEKMRSAFACIGQEPSDNIDAEIDAVRAYCGYEPEGTAYPSLMNFKLREWKEWRIWRSVTEWIKALGD